MKLIAIFNSWNQLLKFVYFDWRKGEVSREPFWKNHPEGSMKKLCLGERVQNGRRGSWGPAGMTTFYQGQQEKEDPGGCERQGLWPTLRPGRSVKCSHPFLPALHTPGHKNSPPQTATWTCLQLATVFISWIATPMLFSNKLNFW